MVTHHDDNYLLGLRFESHYEMFSSLLGNTQDLTLQKYQGDIEDLLTDIKLVTERLKARAPIDGIPDTSEQYKAIKFTYNNYRGETSVRNAIVLSVRWGNTEWHPEYGMLMTAYDLDKLEIREFALKDCDFTSGETAFRAGFEDGADWQSTHERGDPRTAIGVDDAWNKFKIRGKFLEKEKIR